MLTFQHILDHTPEWQGYHHFPLEKKTYHEMDNDYELVWCVLLEN